MIGRNVRRAVLMAGAACAIALAAAVPCGAAIRVVDDSGATVTLAAPARRIVSLAPHATELLFAAGAGERVLGTVEFSDYPEAARAIPRVGSSSLFDMERIVALKPDLVIVWRSGSSETRIERIRALGVPIFYTEPRKLSDIPATLEKLGALAETDGQARRVAAAFRSREAELRSRYAGRGTVTVFWQVWGQPLLTINGRHLISDVIRLCGGANVFDGLGPLVPSVSVEAVVEADPEAIATTGNDAAVAIDDGLAAWRKLTNLRAVSRGNLIVLDADTVHRQSPRVLDGAAALCERLDDVRARRPR